MHSCLTRLETVKISCVPNARKSIVWIANQMHTRTSHARNLKEIEIQTFLIKPLSSLCRGLSLSNAPSALCGSKRLRAATT